ncbi:ATP-binding protein [Kaarinaea lacus]
MFSVFSRLSIRTKLTAIILFAVLSSVSLFSIFIIYLATTSLKETAVKEAETLVLAHSQDFVKIILVNTPDVGADTISRLSQFKNIREIILYDTNNNIVFTYHTDNPQQQRPIAKEPIYFQDGDLHVFQAVKYNETRYGDVYFRLSLDTFTAIVWEFYQASIIAVPFLLVLSLVMALWFQGYFSRPIVELADVMEKITKQKDYSIRVPDNESREIGILNRGFNKMLDIIQNNFNTIRKNQASLARAQKLAHLGYWEYDSDKLTVSDGFRRILNLNGESVLNVRDVINRIEPAAKRQVLRQIASTLKTGRANQFELVLYDAQGSKHYTYGTIESRYDNVHGKHYLSGILQDITEQRQHQEKARQALSEKRKADSENLAKSAFLANMSHELRTPLNAIIGYSELIKEKAESINQDQLVSDSQKVVIAGKYLLSLIKNVLDLSKIEADKVDVHYEQVNVRDVLYEVITTLGPLIDKKGNSISLDIVHDIPSFETDLTKLRQILFNIVGNANKFTDQGEIIVEAWQTENDGIGQCYFRISDTGIGVAPENVRKLFTPFMQADNSITRNHEGTGLGLAISKRYCELLDGNINVESELGKGTVFTLHVPMVTAELTTDRKKKQIAS